MEISKFLKYAFLIDGLVALVYGLWMLVLPEHHATLFNFPYEEFADRFIGALFIGFAIGNLLAYRASSWENVEFVVYMNLTFLIIGLIVELYSIAMALLPVGAFAQVFLTAFLLVLFIYSFYEAKMK
ncbi:MAG: hypothetical protein PVJ05_12225 [Candidatus Thorarchaeota archaeon]|jgi:hypothetical protein